MKRNHFILFIFLLGLTMVSCSEGNDMSVGGSNDKQTAQQVDLLVNVGSRALESLEVSASAAHRAPTFSTMEQLVVIPYHTNNAPVAVTDESLIDLVGATENPNRVESHNTYYVNRCHLMTGTNRMLVYGKAKAVSEDLTINGQLSALPTIRKKTADIQFSLTSIRESTEADADAQALATYMTKIANTEGWSTTDDPTLKSYYLDFIRIGSEGVGLISGAAANIKAFVAALRSLLTGSDDLSTAIKANIDANSTTLSRTA